MTTSTVHIVEDEPLHAALLDRALRLAGFGTSLSTDGPSGWRDIQGRLPALVLLDLMLPGLSGQEICRMVRHNTATRHIPIIMLTPPLNPITRLLPVANTRRLVVVR